MISPLAQMLQMQALHAHAQFANQSRVAPTPNPFAILYQLQQLILMLRGAMNPASAPVDEPPNFKSPSDSDIWMNNKTTPPTPNVMLPLPTATSPAPTPKVTSPATPTPSATATAAPKVSTPPVQPPPTSNTTVKPQNIEIQGPSTADQRPYVGSSNDAVKEGLPVTMPTPPAAQTSPARYLTPEEADRLYTNSRIDIKENMSKTAKEYAKQSNAELWFGLNYGKMQQDNNGKDTGVVVREEASGRDIMATRLQIKDDRVVKIESGHTAPTLTTPYMNSLTNRGGTDNFICSTTWERTGPDELTRRFSLGTGFEDKIEIVSLKDEPPPSPMQSVPVPGELLDRPVISQ